MSETQHPFVTAVILSYNALTSLIEVIRGVEAQTCPVSEIIVVDNGSQDETQTYLENTYQDVVLISLADNVGVGAGHNAGWQMALQNSHCEYIWALEHDCIPDIHCLEKLVEVYIGCSDTDRIGAVSPLQIAAHEYAHNQMTFVWKKRGFTRLEKVRTDSPPHYGRGFTFNGTLFPAKVIRAIGLLNTEFFIGCEDREYSEKLKQKDFQILKVPSAIVWHDIRKSRQRITVWRITFLTPGENVVRSYYGTRNRILLEKSGQNIYLLALKLFLRLPISLLYIMLLSDQKLCRVQARLLAIRDGLCGNSGYRDYSFLRKHS